MRRWPIVIVAMGAIAVSSCSSDVTGPATRPIRSPPMSPDTVADTEAPTSEAPVETDARPNRSDTSVETTPSHDR